MAEKRYGGNYCCVVGCHKNRYSTPKVSMFSFPSLKKDPGRRKKWIQAVRRIRENGTMWNPTKYSRICSDHFISKTPIYHPNNPDYVPSIFPSVYRKKPASNSASQRFSRVQNRKKILCQEPEVVNDRNESKEENSKYIDCAIQTEDQDICYRNMAFLFSCIHENFNCATMISAPTLKKFDCGISATPTLKSTQSGPEHRTVFFNGYKAIANSSDSNACKDLCGVSLQVIAVIISIFGIKNSQRNELKTKDKIILFLMKLKLNITFSALGSLFAIHKTTAAKIFYSVLGTLCTQTKEWIYWLPRYIIQDNMPSAFKIKFANCRTIIDCFEIKTEIPNTVEQQNFMFSNYKNTYTAKYLICIAPHGFIMHISKGYGGRSTDGAITLESELIQALQPGDLVMADRGFPRIKVSCESVGAIFIMPPSAKDCQQFSNAQMSETYNIASVRIHVERVIQRLRIFNIINNKVPTEMLPFLDDIIRIICVLTNLGPPIMAFNNKKQ